MYGPYSVCYVAILRIFSCFCISIHSILRILAHTRTSKYDKTLFVNIFLQCSLNCKCCLACMVGIWCRIRFFVCANLFVCCISVKRERKNDTFSHTDHIHEELFAHGIAIFSKTFVFQNARLRSTSTFSCLSALFFYFTTNISQLAFSIQHYFC